MLRIIEISSNEEENQEVMIADEDLVDLLGSEDPIDLADFEM